MENKEWKGVQACLKGGFIHASVSDTSHPGVPFFSYSILSLSSTSFMHQYAEAAHAMKQGSFPQRRSRPLSSFFSFLLLRKHQQSGDYSPMEAKLTSTFTVCHRNIVHPSNLQYLAFTQLFYRPQYTVCQWKDTMTSSSWPKLFFVCLKLIPREGCTYVLGVQNSLGAVIHGKHSLRMEGSFI